MKLQAFAALCLLMLVASEMAVKTDAACSILQLASCLDASKNKNMVPSDTCCTNIKSMGAGMAGAKCLCSLMDQPLVAQRGVDIDAALSIPARCHANVPANFFCKGKLVPVTP